MFSATLPVILILIIAALLIRQFAYRNIHGNHIIRFVAVGVGALLLAALSDASVPTRKLMYGLSISIIICEGYYLVRPNGRPGFLTGWAGMLPVIVPVLAFSSYWTMLPYFFGFDRGLILLAAAVILAYAVLSSKRTIWDGFWLNALLGSLSAIMLLWMAITAFNRIV